MPSFLLLGGPISAFFAGLTAELHYCTFYSPFPSYKWKKTLLLSFSGLAVLTNGVILIVQTSLMGSPSENASSIYAPWVSYFFVACKYIMYNIRGFSSWLLKIVLFPIVYYSVFLTAPVPGWCLLWHIPSIFTPPSSLYFGWCDTWKWNRVADASDELVISLEAFRSAAFSTTSKALSID